MATEFSLKVIALIRKIPKGRVATYGQIAALAGKPHAARGVSWILHSSSKLHGLPWHRILGAKGRISFPKASRHFLSQQRLLAKERVRVADDGTVDLAEFQWDRKPPRERRTTRPRRPQNRT